MFGGEKRSFGKCSYVEDRNVQHLVSLHPMSCLTEPKAEGKTKADSACSIFISLHMTAAVTVPALLSPEDNRGDCTCSPGRGVR